MVLILAPVPAPAPAPAPAPCRPGSGSRIPRSRPKSLSMSIHTVEFEKGSGKRGLGFSVVGGIDSPKVKLFSSPLEINVVL